MTGGPSTIVTLTATSAVARAATFPIALKVASHRRVSPSRDRTMAVTVRSVGRRSCSTLRLNVASMIDAESLTVVAAAAVSVTQAMVANQASGRGTNEKTSGFTAG